MTYQRIHEDEGHSSDENISHPQDHGAAASAAPAPPPPFAPEASAPVYAAPAGHADYMSPPPYYPVTAPPPVAPHSMEEGGLHIDVTMFDVWRTSLVPEVKDIPQILKAAVLLPCHAAAQQDDINRLHVQAPRLMACGTLAPLVALDLLPCICCGIPFPFGSFSLTLDARRAVRASYRIHGSVMTDVLAAACVPCAMVQLHKEMDVRGSGPMAFTME